LKFSSSVDDAMFTVPTRFASLTAFLLQEPVTIEDLMNISDAGEIMPPKSTWFEPKLRDGLLIHLI